MNGYGDVPNTGVGQVDSTFNTYSLQRSRASNFSNMMNVDQALRQDLDDQRDTDGRYRNIDQETMENVFF
jgi:hypothetical protein